MKRPVILTILMYLILPNILRGVKVRDKNVNYRLTLQKIVIVDVDEDVFKDTYVNLVNKRNSPSVFTLYGTLTKPLNEIWVQYFFITKLYICLANCNFFQFHLNVFYKYKYYREFLIKGDGEFCALVSGQAKNPIYDNLMLPLVMEKHSYFIHDCPYFVSFVLSH